MWLRSATVLALCLAFAGSVKVTRDDMCSEYHPINTLPLPLHTDGRFSIDSHYLRFMLLPPKAERSFKIDYERDTFVMDGKDFRYVAGSFHYFRALPETWRTKLRTLRAGGLNAVDLYVQWSLHNPRDGVYNWEGIANVTDIIEAAIEEDLYVILRPGPYICAEIDNVSTHSSTHNTEAGGSL